MARKGSYNKTIQQVIEDNPDLDVQSTIDQEQLSKSEWLDKVKESYPGAKLGKGISDEEYARLQEKEQQQAPLEVYGKLLEEVEKKLGHYVILMAEEYVPKLYDCLKAHGYTPKHCKSRIYKDCKHIWSIDTMRGYIPEEAKDAAKSRAGRLGNEKKKQLKLTPEFQKSVELNKPSGMYRFITTAPRNIPQGTKVGITFNFDTMSIEGLDFDSTIASAASKEAEEHSCINCETLPPLAKKYCSNKVEAS